jgi:hypothetical protein
MKVEMSRNKQSKSDPNDRKRASEKELNLMVINSVESIE